MENGMEIPQKIKNDRPEDPALLLLGKYLKEIKLVS